MPDYILHPYEMSRSAIERERELGRAREARLAEDAAAGLPGVFPEPDDRPTDRAQWDEIHGRWVEWDEGTDTWKVVQDGYGAADAGTSGADIEPAVVPPAEEPASWVPGDGQSLDDIE